MIKNYQMFDSVDFYEKKNGMIRPICYYYCAEESNNPDNPDEIYRIVNFSTDGIPVQKVSEDAIKGIEAKADQTITDVTEESVIDFWKNMINAGVKPLPYVQSVDAPDGLYYDKTNIINL